MSFSAENWVHLLFVLVVIVIFLVVIFWVLDRLLIMSGGIYLFNDIAAEATSDDEDPNDDELSKGVAEYCEQIEVLNASNGEIICKLR